MLQPLGWWLLAPGRSSLEWDSDIVLDWDAKDLNPVQQRGVDPIHIVLLPGRRWRLERQTQRVGNSKDIPGCAKLTRLSRYPDAYHSCYVLAGLSSTQHYNYSTGDPDDPGTFDSLDSALRWSSSAISSEYERGHGEKLVDAAGKLEALHPIFVIPWAAVDRCSTWFGQKTGF